MTFADTFACTSRAHCRTCRTAEAWRAEVGAPAECPHGVTLDNLPSRGLGDTIAKVANWLGIEQCGGCKKRQRLLNERFPYGSKENMDA